MLKLEDSVGKGGKNRIDDVRLVQQLVNRFRPSQLSLLKVDGLAGVLTTAAIEQFQKDSLNMAMPDGLVSPIGPTRRGQAAHERGGKQGSLSPQHYCPKSSRPHE